MRAEAQTSHQAAGNGRRDLQPSPLAAMFAPERIAIVGASERPGSVGQALVSNLQRFRGALFPVNPKRRFVGGLKAFPSVAALPGRIDLAIIATPASTVPGIVAECSRAGVSTAIIISAGFGERGAPGRELERQCLAAARRGATRLLGPNCLGLMVPHLRLNAMFAKGLAKTGGVAFLSQSGALCAGVLDWSHQKKVGFSAFVSVGSMIDVGWGDLLTHFGDDPHTDSIVCYMESIGDARSFLSAARRVALTKPVVVLKVGRSPAAAAAAASHTGALTGSDAVVDAAFRRVGVLRVDTIDELFSLTELLASGMRPAGSGLAIVTNAGGPGALATDSLVAAGGRLAVLSPGTVECADQFLPGHWSHGNPIDVLGDADAERYVKAVELALNDPQADGVLTVLTPQAMTRATATAKAIKGIAKPRTKPLLTSWTGGKAVAAAKGLLNGANLPTFDYPDAAARAFGLLCRHRDNLKELQASLANGRAPTAHKFPAAARAARAKAARLISRARQAGRTLLTEAESKQILSAYGFAVVSTRIARSEDDAVKHARDLGFPVVVKLHSQTLTHKTEVDGVHLDVRDASQVRRAWKRIQQSVREKAGSRHFLGVTVQPMVRREGYELLLGSSTDPQFGPVILFGTGGQLVEVYHDTAVGLVPLDHGHARRLMQQTKIFAALQGVRGRKPANLPMLEQLLVALGQLVTDQPWIAEADINPLLVSSDQMLVLDARIVLHPQKTGKGALPRPALRPCPGGQQARKVGFKTRHVPQAGKLQAETRP